MLIHLLTVVVGVGESTRVVVTVMAVVAAVVEDASTTTVVESGSCIVEVEGIGTI